MYSLFNSFLTLIRVLYAFILTLWCFLSNLAWSFELAWGEFYYSS